MKIERHPVPPGASRLRIGHLSDLHHGKTSSTGPRFRDALQRVVDYGVDVVIVSGDLAQLPDDHAQLAEVRDVLDAVDVPYLTVSGNHDVRVPGEDGVYASYFGHLPRLERIGDAAFLLFDSFGGLPLADRGPEDYDETWDCYGDGAIDESQFAEMEARLDPSDTTRFAVVHHHLTDEPHPHVNPLRNARRFVRWCADHDVYGVFVGHLHRPAAPVELDGVMRFRTGRTTKTPHPSAVLDMAAREYVVFTES